ncbi:MAG: SDR family NAD(P)-dependent oxidoreductase, partial [Bacteroidota bacterium]
MKDLKNRVVWITGASSGIGEALAYELAKEGAKLILSSRREDELKRVGEKIKEAGGNYLILPLDLTDTPSFEEKKNMVLSKFGRIDMLINNGGISQRSLAK